MRLKKLKKTTATKEISMLLNAVIESEGVERPLPKIANKDGVWVSEASVLVRITQLKDRFLGWNFYTRKCHQTNQRIIGATRSEA